MAERDPVTANSHFTLLDERARPTLRRRIGALLASADEAAFAVARIRLALLDLHDEEVGRLRRCRVLLGQVDAAMLLDASEGTSPPGSGPDLSGLRRFVLSGRLEVRSVGLGAWTPDFGVVSAPSGWTGVFGSIQFGNPELVIGPAFTAVISDPDATRVLLRRFDELWTSAHDVLPAIQEVLERAYPMGEPVPARRGDPGAE
jgi:hypothetical protein